MQDNTVSESWADDAAFAEAANRMGASPEELDKALSQVADVLKGLSEELGMPPRVVMFLIGSESVVEGVQLAILANRYEAGVIGCICGQCDESEFDSAVSDALNVANLN